MLAQTGVDEGHVGHHGHDNRKTDERGTGDVHSRDDARNVHRERGEEDGGQQRQEAAAVFLAEEVFRDVHTHDVECHLGEHLATTGKQLHFAGAEPEQHNQQRGHDQTDHDDAVDLERGSLEQEECREELVDRWANESAAGTFGEHSYSVI